MRGVASKEYKWDNADGKDTVQQFKFKFSLPTDVFGTTEKL
jgi:hypothetical protein